MRIAKRVLAIVLSIVLVVGSFAIATSAADDQKIYVTLKAQVVDPTGASAEESVALGTENGYVASIRNNKITNQRNDVDYYKSNKASIPVKTSADGVIEVNPGQVVWVTTHFRSVGGVYPNVLQAQVYYDTGLFISTAVDGSVCFQWNANNELYKYSSSTLSGGSPYGRQVMDARADYTPADWTAEEDAKYNQYIFYSTDDVLAIRNDTEVLAPQNSDLVTFPIYVKPDATPGSTGTIFVYSHSKLLGSYYPASDYSLELGDYGDAYEDAITFDASMYDLSAATLTFKVAGGEEALDYSALDAQIAAYEAKNAADWTDTSWANATTAYNAAVAAKTDATTQDEVNAAASDLETALANLVEKVVLNYTRIDNAIASVPADLSAYTTTTAAAVAAPLAAAETAKAEATTQDALDNAAAALEAAVAGLALKANFSTLNAAIAEAAGYTADQGWTADSLANLASKVAAAQTIDQDNTPVADQAAVNAAAEAIYEAIEDLEKEVVLDYTAWNDAVAQIPADLSVYTPASVSAYNAAKDAAYSAYDVAVALKDQAGLNDAAAALVAAIAELKTVADKAALVAAINEANAKDAGNYTPASWAAADLANVVAAAQAVNADANATQAAVDAQVEAINAAIAKLVAPADKAALQAAIADVPTYAADMYANWDQYADALAAAEEVYADANASADAVAEATSALVAAKGALVVADADYSAVEAAKDAIPADLETAYTPDSVARVKEAVAAVVVGLKKTEQARVDEFASAINAAVAGLEKFADYSAVEAAKDAIPADLSIYTDDSVAALNEAVAAVVYGLGANAQSTVDDYAAAIVEKTAALVEKDADYSAVEAAKTAAANVNRALYTAASLAKLDEAVAAVVEGYKISKQADVDAMAKAITDAIDALDLKPTEGAVKEVSYDTTSPYNVNDFSFKVDGRAVKIRIADCDDTTITLTYNRALAREKGSIVSYNAAGEVVSDLSRDIAYEIWTINDLYLDNGNYYAVSKDNYGWEDYEIATIFEVAPSTANSAVDSITASTTAPVAGESVDIEIVTGSDVLKVQLLIDGVEYKTYNNPTVADGKATFNTTAKFSKGEHTVTIKIKTADGWSEVVDGASVTVNASMPV